MEKKPNVSQLSASKRLATTVSDAASASSRLHQHDQTSFQPKSNWASGSIEHRKDLTRT
ncbi:unnamed protein product [Protopolystoma xenopodis]|uniref:Uncharacterized protein n=1 Tax=Protopolystoma xenopodis TaxID=117903 RepID=A0A3S5AZP9_9PLAT|nr:unnamed protein product [Protopolystoma xenopodis]